MIEEQCSRKTRFKDHSCILAINISIDYNLTSYDWFLHATLSHGLSVSQNGRFHETDIVHKK